MKETNYVQIRIPVENAQLVFKALAGQHGTEYTEEQALELEEAARARLIAHIESVTTEWLNVEAIIEAEKNRPELNIT